MASPPPPTPFLYAGGTNISVTLQGTTIFALLAREVTFWGKYLHWGTIFFFFFFFFFFFDSDLLLKVTSATKLFLPQSSPWCAINDFFFFSLKKKYLFLEISRFLCFCEIHWFQNLWCQHGSYTYFLNPKYYQNEFGQILVWSMTNISNIFLAQCWRL